MSHLQLPAHKYEQTGAFLAVKSAFKSLRLPADSRMDKLVVKRCHRTGLPVLFNYYYLFTLTWH